MPLNSLQRLLQLTVNVFDVVYSRPRAPASGHSCDDNVSCDYPDRAVIRQFAHVTDFEAACESGAENYNQAKLEVLSKSHVFVAVQGGGPHLLACFGESLFLLLHNAGGNIDMPTVMGRTSTCRQHHLSCSSRKIPSGSRRG
jgi:hypothetical protein